MALIACTEEAMHHIDWLAVLTDLIDDAECVAECLIDFG